MKRLPAKGMERDAIFEKMESYRATDMDWRKGKSFGYVYDPGEETFALAQRAYMKYLAENALDPTVYPSLLKLENDIVGIAVGHLSGDENTVGTFTSGGTESILLAIKTARDLARATRGVTDPEIVVPTTGHASAQKAAHYFGIKVVLVEVDPKTFKADPEAMRAAITPNTILLFASAPSYAHGVIDPIEEIAQVALEHEIPMHVDACVGGWLLPYFRRLGSPIPDFDFSVPGVTSISMDLHKYAFAAKGASLLMYRDKSIRAHQIYACARWTGYTFLNTNIQSSRTAGPIAAAWAVLHHIGDDGYLEYARQLRDETKALADGIAAIDGLYLMAAPEFSMFSFTSDSVNIFHIADEMNEKGWYIQPQLKYGASKENIHISVNPGNVGLTEAFLADLAVAVETAKTMPSGGLAGMADELAAFGDAGLANVDFGMLMTMAGVVDNVVPKRMADINELLNRLPAELAETLLSAFMNELFKPAL